VRLSPLTPPLTPSLTPANSTLHAVESRRPLEAAEAAALAFRLNVIRAQDVQVVMVSK